MTDDPARMLAALKAAVAIDREHRRQVQLDVAWLAAHPDSTAKAREPVYRGWSLSASDVPFAPCDD